MFIYVIDLVKQYFLSLGLFTVYHCFILLNTTKYGLNLNTELKG